MNVHEIIQECQEEAEYYQNDVAKVVFLAMSSKGLGYREYEILSRIFLALSGKDEYSAPRDGNILLDALEEMGFYRIDLPQRERR